MLLLETCNIAPSTLRKWAADPELAELIETLKMHSQGYYENLACENILNKDLNATLLLGIMGTISKPDQYTGEWR